MCHVNDNLQDQMGLHEHDEFTGIIIYSIFRILLTGFTEYICYSV